MQDEKTWKDWVKHHCEFFGWNDEAGQTMLGKWSHVFEGFLYEPEELIKATNSIAIEKIYKREDHINRLIQYVRSERESKRNHVSSAPTTSQQPDCKLCFGCGLVTVPHLKFVVNYSWTIKRTFAVSCSCFNGLPYRLSTTKRMMTLTEYQTKNTDWKNHLRMQAEDEKKISELYAECAPKAHLKLDATVKTIMNRFKKGE